MGNCQAIDNATLMIQHPCGRVDTLYSPISALEIMKLNPSHHVALLLTSSMCTSTSSSENNNRDGVPIRVTRIKLLKPSDTLLPGHVYRLVTSQEVTRAKRQAKMQQKHERRTREQRSSSELETGVQTNNQVMNEEESARPRNVAAAPQRSRAGAWQPTLRTISESGT